MVIGSRQMNTLERVFAQNYDEKKNQIRKSANQTSWSR